MMNLKYLVYNESYLSCIVHPLDTKPTKCSILSEIVCIFDPLDLVNPVIFLAKHLIQL